LAFVEEYEVSVKFESQARFPSKLIGDCDALLLALVGALQIGLLMTFVDVSSARGDAVIIDPDQASVARQAYVEVIVVEARKVSRG
jgi:hypothetical protein